MSSMTNTASMATGTASNPTKLITCYRSGVPLARVETLCSMGWPFLNASSLNEMYHPIYSLSLEKLLPSLRDKLNIAEQAAWMLPDHELREIALVMSAIMYELDAMWQPAPEAISKLEASLPHAGIVAGCGSRLLSLAGWYHFATSKRMSFPTYRASKLNSNLGWENYAGWLDDAFEIKAEWEAGRTQLERDEILKKRTEALLTVKAENIYKRIDFNKVWNWIDIQLVQDGRYSAGRRETFKTIFMKGDMSPEDWILDDVEDLQMAITECCDIGNEITFFINNRLNTIKEIINSFYSSFTLLTHSVNDVTSEQAMTELEKEKTGEFFAKFDSKLATLQGAGIQLPPAPQRNNFTTLGLFLKAQAEWNILKRRADAFAQRNEASQQESKQEAQQESKE